MSELQPRAATSATANSGAGAHRFGATSKRPTVLAPRSMVSTGHYLASAAAAHVLAEGGNAVDAGVAAGLVLNVVHNDMNTLSGVAPIVLSVDGRTRTIAGVGTWPHAIDRVAMRERYGRMPADLMRCVVPAAAAAWLVALRDFGTWTFERVSATARGYARDGFPVHTFMHHSIRSYLSVYQDHPENARIFLRDGHEPPVGEMIVQPELANTLDALAGAERAAEGDRAAGIVAVLDYFYRGPVARAMAEFAAANGGVLDASDLAAYEVEVGDPVTVPFLDLEVAVCGPWSQGPTLAIALGILQSVDVAALGHNTTAYINTVASALDLAFADRNAHLGDPRCVEVPLAALLDPAYLRARAALLPPAGSAYREPPPPGDPEAGEASAPHLARTTESFGRPAARPPGDTSCVTVIDANGNAFAATPSDGYCSGPVIPGLGLHISERGSQSFLADDDPNAVAPGKRPRLTPNPVLLLRDGRPVATMATPGNDRQVQAMVQVLLNRYVFGMEPQAAVEAPRFGSYNFRASSWPGNLEPGRLCVEEDVDETVRDELAAWGRDVRTWPTWCWSAGGVCLSSIVGGGVRAGAADPRRESYAVGG